MGLKYYRLEKKFSGTIAMVAVGIQDVSGPTETGTSKTATVEERLSKIIEMINTCFGTDFDAQDLIDGVEQQLAADTDLQQTAQANTKENFNYVFDPALDKRLVERHGKHKDFINSIFGDKEMKDYFHSLMAESIYEKFSKRDEAGASQA